MQTLCSPLKKWFSNWNIDRKGKIFYYLAIFSIYMKFYMEFKFLKDYPPIRPKQLNAL